MIFARNQKKAKSTGNGHKSIKGIILLCPKNELRFASRPQSMARSNKLILSNIDAARWRGIKKSLGVMPQKGVMFRVEAPMFDYR